VTPYTVEFHAKADAECVGLPDDAFKLLLETLVVVSRDPWATTRQDRPDEAPSFRWAVFGAAGLVHVTVDDERRVVRVHGISWIG
jgi:hypothetical protein